MKKVIISENELINIIEKLLLESDYNERYIIVSNSIKKPGKPLTGKMVWGKYKDGSTIFIPFGNYISNNSKPIIYSKISDAEKDIKWLKRTFPNAEITIEPLK